MPVSSRRPSPDAYDAGTAIVFALFPAATTMRHTAAHYWRSWAPCRKASLS